MKLIERIENNYFFENDNEEKVHITADSLEDAERVFNELLNYEDRSPVVKMKSRLINQARRKAKDLLSATDYKVIRHRDQKYIGAETSLTEIEYIAFLTERNEIRKNSNKFEAEIQSLSTLEELKNYKIEY